MMFAPKKVYFYITGFGKFANILENPSTHLVNALPRLLKNQANTHLAHSEIVTVSCEDCDVALDRIYAKVQKNLQRSNGTRHIILNFGVAASRHEFSLECRAKNIKDFRFPDERGNVFKSQPIEGDDTSQVKFTTINLETICKTLSSKHKVSVSDNAGEYICNYMLYKHLQRSQILANPKVESFFVHIPTFESIP